MNALISRDFVESRIKFINDNNNSNSSDNNNNINSGEQPTPKTTTTPTISVKMQYLQHQQNNAMNNLKKKTVQRAQRSGDEMVAEIANGTSEKKNEKNS